LGKSRAEKTRKIVGNTRELYYIVYREKAFVGLWGRLVVPSPFLFLGGVMARSPLEEYAISRKIVKLMREGYGQEQATAIAFRMFRDGELNLPKTQKQIKDEREKRRKKWYLDRTRRSRR
jgi:hypothetical protein